MTILVCDKNKRIKYIFILMLVMVVFHSCCTEKSQKEFIINNIDKFEKLSDNSFVIEKLDGYYTEKTISFQTDSSFTIICWGDRNSILWYLKKDKKITVSIPYDRSKNENVDIDVKLMNVFNKKRKS